ncbi:MAG: repeat-containing protein [Planctomycetaceae bacterium]|nr:repeat-containing protein [Planctomycetaceae bacterium]
MINFSCRQWLVNACAFGFRLKARKRPNFSMFRVEGLEDRALLTAPVAVDDSHLINEDQTLNGASMLSNDTDLDDTIVAASLENNVQHGTLNLQTDGTFTYTPFANYNGSDSFSYFAKNSGDESSATSATVTITVNAVVDLTANIYSLSTNEDTLLSDSVATNDSTTSGGTLAYALDTQAGHGTVSVNSDGTFTYLPSLNFHGTDSFSYTVTDADANETATKTVSITVNAVADLTANDYGLTTNEDTLLSGSVATNDSTTSGGALSYALDTQASSGTASVNSDGAFTYLPGLNFHGTDSFTYTVTDADANETATKTVSITVNAVADLTANDYSFSTNEDTLLSNSVATNDSTTSGGALVYALGVQASHGTATVNADGTFTYLPGSNFHGSDSFTYTVTDAAANETATKTVLITVNSVNDAPATGNGSGTLAENGFLSTTVAPYGFDADGDALTFVVTTQPTHGMLTLNPSGSFTYLPNAGYSGPDQFTFKANDGLADSNIATFSITVTAVDQPLTLTLTSDPTNVAKTGKQVQIDPAAAVNDFDTVVNYGNAKITLSILSGNTPDDVKHGRVKLSVHNQGTGTGLVKVKGLKIYFDGSKTSIATITVGTNVHPLVVTFSSTATQQQVNAVLKQLSIQASKKASTGNRTIGFEVLAGGQTAHANKTVNIS